MPKKSMLPFYRCEPDGSESCFLVELGSSYAKNELEIIGKDLSPFFKYLPSHRVTLQPTIKNVGVVGPRLSTETPHSSGAVQILRSCGAPDVRRIETFRCYPIPGGIDREKYLSTLSDPVTECMYDQLPTSYMLDYVIPKVEVIPVLEEGIDALRRYIDRANEAGAGYKFGDYLLSHIVKMSRSVGYNPTDVTIAQYAQMWSDHCRHILFMLTRLHIDGVMLDKTLFQLLREPFDQIRDDCNVTIGFHDNGSAIVGYTVPILRPARPGEASPYVVDVATYHITWSAETHNYPNHVSPKEGSATEIGGEIRDELGIGRGSDILFAGCGRVVGSLRFANGYRIPGEFLSGRPYGYPSNKAMPMKIVVDGLDGWQSYANCFGKPNPLGFFYSGAIWRPRRIDDHSVPSVIFWRPRQTTKPFFCYERLESLKPASFGLAVGTVRKEHIEKRKAKAGWLVGQIGGKAFRIGKSGGLGSSDISGSNSAKFDLNAVQRGDPVMERLFYQVILACIARGEDCPLEIIHDQGAGGISNVLTELVEKTGGRLYLGAVNRGDPTLTDLEVWICEYQERQGFVIRPEKLPILVEICEREGCPLEIIGEITGDGILRVYTQSSADEVEAEQADPIVMFNLEEALANLPMTDLYDETPEDIRIPIEIPADLTYKQALFNVLHRSEVGSKEGIIRGVDTSIGNQIIQNQWCGQYPTPVNDCAIAALSRQDYSKGVAASHGVAPYLTALDPASGVRVSMGEAITNLMGVKVDFEKIQFVLNWMWPANIKPPDGEIARLATAVQAVNKLLLDLRIYKKCIVGGKDSPSMATVVENEGLVKSIETAVYSTAVDVFDTKIHITPEIRYPGQSQLVYLDIANGRRRLGGSSFGQSLGQLGADCPDLDEPDILVRAFQVMMNLLDGRLVTAGHDVSDGGLVVTALEMCLAAGCGAKINLPEGKGIYEESFAQELGFVVECPTSKIEQVIDQLAEAEVPFKIIGTTTEAQRFLVNHNSQEVLNESLWTLRREWERTGYQLRRERLKTCKHQADLEWRNTARRSKPVYQLSFEPSITAPEILVRDNRPKVAIVREIGSNGHPEMIDAWHSVGFEAWEVHMSDLERGKVENLAPFKGLIIPGGFSNGDILGAAVGWAMKLKRNPVLRRIFEEFFAREDTFSFGTCNGAQLGLRCGWAPYPDLPEELQPRFTKIPIGSFNHQWIRLRIDKSPAVMLKGMEGSILGAWVANGEGYFNCDHAPQVYEKIFRDHLAPLIYVDAQGRRTKALPHCPSGSFVAGVCDLTGRHLYMMPHAFDRGNALETWGYVPPEMEGLEAAPWLEMGHNAYRWVMANIRL